MAGETGHEIRWRGDWDQRSLLRVQDMAQSLVVEDAPRVPSRLGTQKLQDGRAYAAVSHKARQ